MVYLGYDRSRVLFSLFMLTFLILIQVSCSPKLRIDTENMITKAETTLLEARKNSKNIQEPPPELMEAEDGLYEAKNLLIKGEYEQAYFLAEKAWADATLANAKAQSEKEKESTQEMLTDIEESKKHLEEVQSKE